MVTLDELRAATLRMYPHAFDGAGSADAGEFEWDTPQGGTPYREMPPAMLAARLAAVADDRSKAAFALIAELQFGYGYSPRQIFDLFVERADDAPLLGHYADKGDGCEKAIEYDVRQAFATPNPNRKSDAETWKDVQPPEGPQPQTTKMRLVNPSEAMRRKPPVYWDKEKLFLRSTGGSASICYAEFSNFKTTFCAGHAIAVARATGAKVLYIVSEGADGFGPLTLQAAVKDWNEHHADQISPDWLDAHLQLIEVAPQIMAAGDLKAVKELCEAAGFAPDLVFFDTLGASAAGQNLNAIEVGTMIGSNLRAFCRDIKADCWLVHHLGKDEKAGPTGSRYLMNDADMALWLAHAEHVLVVTVTKDRWGKKNREEKFGTRTVHGLDIEGTAEKASFVAVYELGADDPRRHAAMARDTLETLVRKVLAVAGAINVKGAIREDVLLDRLANLDGECPKYDADGIADWGTRRDQFETQISVARRNKRAWTFKLFEMRRPAGASKSQPLWFVRDGAER
jgi:hypothetical protein